MSRMDRLACVLSLLAVLLSYQVADRVFERMAHLEDEMAYVWQAQVLAHGKLALPASPEPQSFLVPFVVDYNGLRFGKYPLGWPLVLALGVALGARAWVNPLLAGLGLWLMYLLGKRVFGPRAGLLAAVLLLVSPFFLLNSGSLLSHPLGLVLSTAFSLAWLEAFTEPRSQRPLLFAVLAGLALLALVQTRPLTAVAVALPFGLHGLYLLARGSWETRRRVILVGLLALLGGELLLAWQRAMTGDPLLNPYTLWWPYDKIGFGPGVGFDPAGHTLQQAWINAGDSMESGYRDLLGWGPYSWIFLPAGLLAVLRAPKIRRGQAWLVSSVFVSLILVYMTYWIGSWLFGPRYYYEGTYSWILLSAVGILYLAGRLDHQFTPGIFTTRPRLPLQWPVFIMVAILLAYNIFLYLPGRLSEMTGLYGISRAPLAPFLQPEAQAFTPALIFVDPAESWTEYGALLELQDAFLTTPFVFAYMRQPSANQNAIDALPGRAVFYYYTDEPYIFYTQQRPP